MDGSIFFIRRDHNGIITKVQRRDLSRFIEFMIYELGNDKCINWTPRFSQCFKSTLQKTTNPDDSRRWNDSTINRMLAHLKTFANWVHKHQPFPLGNPMENIKQASTESLLDVERALTPEERRRMLDAADLLVKTGGRSKDRNRYRKSEIRPQHKSFRGWRNRAIVYTLIETGMRCSAVTTIDLKKVEFEKRIVPAIEKGGDKHNYKTSREGIEAIQDYLDHERTIDAKLFHSCFVFTGQDSTDI